MKRTNLNPGDNLKANITLPFLPGNQFTDPRKDNFAVSQTLWYKDGLQTEKLDYAAIGREFRHEFDTRLADQCEVDDEINPYLGWSRKNIEWGTIAQGEKA
ncbi:MAG: hypothetical protein EZS28_009259, partial [Streblomastix strix]